MVLSGESEASELVKSELVRPKGLTFALLVASWVAEVASVDKVGTGVAEGVGVSLFGLVCA